MRMIQKEFNRDTMASWYAQEHLKGTSINSG